MSVCLLALFLANSDAFRLTSHTPEIAVETEPSGLNDVQLDGAVSGEVRVGPGQKLGTGIQSEPSAQGCAVRLWGPYERFLRTTGGIVCFGVAAQEGSTYSHVKGRYMGTIKSILVWTRMGWKDRPHLAAIRVKWDDGSVSPVFGRPHGLRNPVSFEFRAGEYVVGDIRLSGNGVGRFLGSIEFATSAGRKFYVGTQKGVAQQWFFPTGGAFWSGFSGWAKDDIFSMILYFWKPISNIKYEDLTYPTLSDLGRLSSPTSVRSRTYCNSLPFALPAAGEQETTSWEIGESTCVETSATFQFGKKLTVTGNIPFVAKIESEVSWNLSNSRTVTNCETQTRTVTKELNFPNLMIPAYTQFDYSFTQWSGVINGLPFRATLVITFNDSSSVRRTEVGTYTGVSYTDVKQVYRNYKENVTDC